MGRPAKFSRERLQSAALDLVDEHGVEGLSMRTLAAALGTGPMTLYNHVANREDLEVLVVEAVMGKADWPRKRREDWRAEVREIAIGLWRTVRAHPRVIPLIATRRSRSPAVLEVSEALLEALARSGRTRQRLLIAFRAVTALVMGFAQVELTSPLSAEAAAVVIQRFRSLPRGRNPRLVEIATAAVRSDVEKEFRQGLEILIAGLEGAAARPRSGRGRRR